jgi:hypothetical protein
MLSSLDADVLAVGALALLLEAEEDADVVDDAAAAIYNGSRALNIRWYKFDSEFRHHKRAKGGIHQ